MTRHAKHTEQVPDFQDLVLSMQQYWADYGCILQQPYDIEVGAGTMNPDTFFRVLGKNPWEVVYIEPSRRPADGRYGENPHRVEKHHQLQVILKPSPPDVQEIYLDSLTHFGIRAEEHDIRFDEDDWQAPTLGAWGVGWQVLLDGLEITQFTYFQQAGGIDLDPVSVELTYGIERIATFLHRVQSLYDLPWNKRHSYRDLRFQAEREFSLYNFEHASISRLVELFRLYEEEASDLLEEGLVLPAYDYCLKCSHTFNILDARKAISVTERTSYVQRIMRLSCRCAEKYVASE